MNKFNKLIRDNVSNLLEQKGYQVDAIKLKGDKYKYELYSLFLQEFKASEKHENKEKVKICYADMFDILYALMKYNKGSEKELTSFDEQQPLTWYKKMLPSKLKMQLTRMNLLEKYNELLELHNNEVIKDQLKELFNGLKDLVEANKLSLKEVEKIRQQKLEKQGGFSKGIYLQGVSKTVNTANTI